MVDIPISHDMISNLFLVIVRNESSYQKPNKIDIVDNLNEKNTILPILN